MTCTQNSKDYCRDLFFATSLNKGEEYDMKMSKSLLTQSCSRIPRHSFEISFA